MVKKILVLFFLIAFLFQLGFCDEWDIWDKYTLQRWNLHIHTSDSQDAWYKLYSLGYAIYSCFGSIDHIPALNPYKTIQKGIEYGIHLGLSDHSFKYTSQQFDVQKKLCKDSKFTCLAGQEITIMDNNHINTYNFDKVISTEENASRSIVVKNIDDLLRLFHQYPYIIGQINHPLYVTTKEAFDFTLNPKQYPLKNWNNYLDLNQDPRFCLMEVNSKLPQYVGIKYHLKQYILALQAGLKVAPTIGEDNFGPLSKNTRIRHTGIYVEYDNEESIKKSMRNKLIFASEDGNFEFKYMAKSVDKYDYWHLMGDEVVLADNQKMMVAIKLDDPDEAVGQLVLINVELDKSKVITKKQCDYRSQSYFLTLNPYDKKTICIIALVIQKDGDWIMGAPIWIKYSGKPAPTTPIYTPPVQIPPYIAKPTPTYLPPATLPTVQTPSHTRYTFEKTIAFVDDLSSLTVCERDVAISRYIDLVIAKPRDTAATAVKIAGQYRIENLNFVQFVATGEVILAGNVIDTNDRSHLWQYNRLIHYWVYSNKSEDVGSFNSQYTKATCLDRDGNIIVLVCPNTSSYIQKIDQSGNILSRLDLRSRPADIAVDPSNNIYVLMDKYIEIYDSNLRYIRQIKVTNISPDDIYPGRLFLKGGTSTIAIDDHGNIFIGWWDGYVQIYDRNMRLITGFKVRGALTQMRIDHDGRIYLMGQLYPGIIVFKPY